MEVNKIISAMRRMKVETGSFVCWGCGYEHNCGVHGCAILREAVDALERLNDFDQTKRRKMLVKLQKAQEELDEMKRSGWISVKDRLPEPGEIVLVHQVYSWQQFEDGVAVTVGRLRPTENGRVSYWEFQYYRPDFRDGTVLDNGIICPGNEYITHWMPLPSAEELK